MDLQLYLSFCLASFLLALMPGPDNILVLTESLAKGSRNGIYLSLGFNSGVLLHTLAAATGLSLLLQQSSLAFSILQYAGVAYLLYLAYLSYQEDGNMDTSGKGTGLKQIKLFKRGITMNLLNPKVSLFFIAFLPQFVAEDGLSPMWQMSMLGISFMLIGFFTFSGIALLAHQIRKSLQQPNFWKWMKGIKISVLLLLAAFLLWNG